MLGLGLTRGRGSVRVRVRGSVRVRVRGSVRVRVRVGVRVGVSVTSSPLVASLPRRAEG